MAFFIFGRGNADLNAEELGYFKDETNNNLIAEFVGLRFKMYSLTVCDEFEPFSKVNYPRMFGTKLWQSVWSAHKSNALSSRTMCACSMELLLMSSNTASPTIFTICA